MIKYIFTIFVFLAAFAGDANAQGNLFISPQRIGLTEKAKIGQLHLVNKSDQAKTYEIKLVDYAMQENGSLSLANEMQNSAKGFLRYSPRRVSLEAGADQYIRIMARIPRDLENGGYHTHIEFNEVPGAQNRGGDNDKDLGSNSASFQISSTYSVAIPVFVNNGETAGKADLISATPKINADRKTGTMKVKIKRSGNGASYNLVKTEYIDSQGKVHLASTPARIPVYRERDEVNREFLLKLPDGESFNGGKIRVSLHEIDSKNQGSPLDVVTAEVK